MTEHVRAIALAVLVVAAALGPIAQPAAAQASRSVVTGYAGALPKDPRDRARTYFDQPAVRALIRELEHGPLPAAEAEARLGGSPATLADLARLRLVRQEAGVVRLGFAYFTAADMRRIHAVAARHVPSLTAAFQAESAAYAALWARYPPTGVDRRHLAFVVVSGIGLNWDALDLLEERGWRRPLLVTGPGWRYSFFASEAPAGFSYKGLYWGSSAFPADLPLEPPMPAAYASFGDGLSDPRMNLPDILGLRAPDMAAEVRAAAARLGLAEDPLLGRGVLGVQAGRGLGRLLLRLRARPATAAELQADLPGEPVPEQLALLEALAYVHPAPDGRYALSVPVLDFDDKAMLDEARALTRTIVQRWLEAEYDRIRQELSGLTALEQGVPYEALFTQIWHELFGLATRELAASGFTADPYAPPNPAPGSLGVVWRAGMVQREWR